MTKQRPEFIAELQKELSEIKPRHGNLPNEDLFVMWFLLAEWGAAEVDAANAITNGPKDKDVDALLIDETAKTVCVVQGKYRQKVGEKSEVSKDVDALITVVDNLTIDSDNCFNEWVETGNKQVKEKLRYARTRVRKDGYRIKLYFVTLGKFPKTVNNKSIETMLRDKFSVRKLDIVYELFDGSRCKKLWEEWEGGGPLPPSLELEMADAPNVTSSGTLQRHDKRDEIETWVFAMRGDKIAELYLLAKERLFAWNVRGDAGVKTPANKQMKETLLYEPERFFYYNNGITMLCEDAKEERGRGAKVLRVTKPQVINGQQTTRTLARVMEVEATKAKVAKASVLVKVICVRGREDEYERIEGLRSNIITGTNRQTAITLADLKANDKRQIVLEKALKRMNYEYLRKKRETAEVVGGKYFHRINKSAFAQAVAACDYEPALARSSKNHLFEDATYKKMFPTDDPFYYLTRYWLMQAVRKTANFWEEQNKREPKWMVLNFVWSKLRSRVQGSRAGRFCDLCRQRDRDEEFNMPLGDAIKKVFVVGLKFFEANRGPTGQRVDIETFYKNASRADVGAFREFFKTCDRESQAFSKYFDKAVAVLME